MAGVASDITGIGEVATAAQKILSMVFPDKSAEEQQKLAAALAIIQSQTAIDQAEATSTDPLQHWRGALGWVCAAGYAWNFVIQPLGNFFATLAGHTINAPALDITQLSVLTLGMLGLGGMHLAGQIQGVK